MGVWAELLFGEGFWMGLLLMNSLLFIVSSIVSKFGLFAGVFSGIMFVVYTQELSSLNQIETFGIIFQLVLCLIYFYLGYKNN